MSLGGFGLGGTSRDTLLQAAMPNCLADGCPRPIRNVEWNAVRASDLDPGVVVAEGLASRGEDEDPWVYRAVAVCPAGHRIRVDPFPLD